MFLAGYGLSRFVVEFFRQADARFIGIEHLTERELDAILAEVEARGIAVHQGKPARAIKGKPARRAGDIEAEQPKKASPKARA